MKPLDDPQTSRVAEVFAEHRRFIEAVAARELNGDRVEAAEIVQDVAVQLCRRALDGLRNPDALRSWLGRVAINRARDRRRARGSEDAFLGRYSLSLHSGPIVDPDQVAIAGDDRAAILRAIQALPAVERYTVRGRFGLGRQARHGERTLAEVGAELGLSVEGVRKAQARALDKLRRRLSRRRPSGSTVENQDRQTVSDPNTRTFE